MKPEENIIIYNTADGQASVSLYTKDGQVWMNQAELAALFDTSVPNISIHISNILKDKEIDSNSVVKDYLTTATDGKQYSVTFYALEMILAIGFRVRSKRGTQFRTWANRHLKNYMIKGFIIDSDRFKNPRSPRSVYLTKNKKKKCSSSGCAPPENSRASLDAIRLSSFM